jgi:PPOX class probable F420-dependent enzyme
VPAPPVPPAIDEFLGRPNPSIIATLTGDGSPLTVPTWYDWEDGRVLVNLNATRARLRFMHVAAPVALTVLDAESWYRHVSLMGEIEELLPDPDLRDIDRLSTRYTGEPHGDRHGERWSAWIAVRRWHGWDGSAAWNG